MIANPPGRLTEDRDIRAREFFILNNLFNTKNLAISIICFIFAQKQNVWQ